MVDQPAASPNRRRHRCGKRLRRTRHRRQKSAGYGFDSLEELGFAILPNTRMSQTASSGLHLHFDPADHGIRNTAGKKGRGIGPGLDWRGDGGYVILPAPGSGYAWARIMASTTR